MTHRNRKNGIRIIAGQWRGRKLAVPPIEGLRPTGDRMRETLFNWLQGRLSGLHCLDLFAGSGALGLEALSRGAAFAQFIDANKAACDQLQTNIDLLKAPASVIRTDALQWLGTPPHNTFGLVFLDPPFAQNLWQPCLVKLYRLLPQNALIYLEAPKDFSPDFPSDWQCLKSKNSGNVLFCLLEKAHPENDK